ncbi:PssE/Cps14G family polysaccharide biosynthesis glycosyltransferase [Clostridium tertium]|uniref:PssE/Cps14G family polysaccharide biosynthesis glycosyltransferase n=1 Tax=Clostridium tertium TaxID=1559 RepID=UPI003DA573C9
MIFITLGSQKFQFNRLLKKIDELIVDGVINESVYAQIGYSDYKPLHFKYSEFMDRDKFSGVMRKSDLVITHGGTGAIITAVKANKKVIAVARLAKYGEHVDDHQLQLISQFEDLNLIYACKSCDEINMALKTIRNKKFSKYISNTDKYIKSIDKYIEVNFMKKEV